MKNRTADHTKLPPICTAADLAPVMRKNQSTLWRWIADGVIPKNCTVHIGTGKHVRLFTERLRAAGLLPLLPNSSGAASVVRALPASRHHSNA